MVKREMIYPINDISVCYLKNLFSVIKMSSTLDFPTFHELIVAFLLLPYCFYTHSFISNEFRR